MEAGVDTPPPTHTTGLGISLDLSLPDSLLSSSSSSSSSSYSSSSSPPRIPKRLRQRLLVECKSPSTVVEIQAKLRHADLRRQVFNLILLFLIILSLFLFFFSLEFKA